ncbi:MAG: hypothetical protein NVS1B13_18840 [Flavisolibacter sp.]
MNLTSNKLFTLIFSTVIFIACTKQKLGPLTDLRPAIPVSVQNSIDNRPGPTVNTSIAGGGVIQIILTIPSSSGRSIKEITKVVAESNYAKLQNSLPGYSAGPIAGSGTSVTFTTSLSEYYAKYPPTKANPATTENNELPRRFYFLLTLDDGTTIITEPVRVLVLT